MVEAILLTIGVIGALMLAYGLHLTPHRFNGMDAATYKSYYSQEKFAFQWRALGGGLWCGALLAGIIHRFW